MLLLTEFIFTSFTQTFVGQFIYLQHSRLLYPQKWIVVRGIYSLLRYFLYLLFFIIKKVQKINVIGLIFKKMLKYISTSNQWS